MTYIDDARTALAAELPALDLVPDLLDLYVLLTLVRGDAVTLADVHDAWAVWRSSTQPDHRSIVPFDQLTVEVQALDKPYADAIKAAASQAGVTPAPDHAEARVTALYEAWFAAGPPPLGTSLSRWWDARLVELAAAISGPDTRQ